MRAENRAEQIVRACDVRHPIAHSFVNRVFQSAAAGIHSDYIGAEQAHAEHVQPLALHIFRAHVNRACEAELRRDCRRRHAVLARAGLSDDSLLSHARDEQPLAEGVIDFVRAGVQQIFALNVDTRAAQMRGEPFRELQRRGTPGEITQQ